MEYKRKLAEAIESYFGEKDIDAMMTSLAEAKPPELRHLFVKAAVVSSMQRNDMERELVSAALQLLRTC